MNRTDRLCIVLAALLAGLGASILPREDTQDPLHPESSRAVRQHPASLTALRESVDSGLAAWQTAQKPVPLSDVHRLEERLEKLSWLEKRRGAVRRLYSRPEGLARASPQERLEARLASLRLQFDEGEAEEALKTAIALRRWDVGARLQCCLFERTGQLCPESGRAPVMALMTARCLLEHDAEEPAIDLLNAALSHAATTAEATHRFALLLSTDAPEQARSLLKSVPREAKHLETEMALGRDPRHGLRLSNPVPAGPALALWSVALWPAEVPSPSEISIEEFTRNGALLPGQRLVAELSFARTGLDDERNGYTILLDYGAARRRWDLSVTKHGGAVGELVKGSAQLQVEAWRPDRQPIAMRLCLDSQCEHSVNLSDLRIDPMSGSSSLARFLMRNKEGSAAARVVDGHFWRSANGADLDRLLEIEGGLPDSVLLGLKALRFEARGETSNASTEAARALLAAGLDRSLSPRGCSAMLSLAARGLPSSPVAYLLNQLAVLTDRLNLRAQRALREVGREPVRPAQADIPGSEWIGPMGGNLGIEATAVLDLDFIAGLADLELEMRGARADGQWPRAQLRWNGAPLAELEVASPAWKRVRAEVQCLEGRNRLEVEFLNDYWSPQSREDRNLYLGRVQLRQRPAQLPETTGER